MLMPLFFLFLVIGLGQGDDGYFGSDEDSATTPGEDRTTTSGTSVPDAYTPVECSTWGPGGFRSFSDQYFYYRSNETYTFTRHNVESESDFNVEFQRKKDGNIKRIVMKVYTDVIDVDNGDVSVNNKSVSIPHYTEQLSITTCGIFNKMDTKKNIMTLMWKSDMLSVQLYKPYATSGICGNAGDSQGEITAEYIEQQRVGEQSESGISYMGTDELCDKGVQKCNIVCTLFGEEFQGYMTTCATAYCTGDGLASLYPTLEEVARKASEMGCSEAWRYWRTHPAIVDEMPSCPNNQVFDDCAPLLVPTCCNPVPVKGKVVTSGCICPEGLVLDDVNKNGSCVMKEQCPCAYNGTIYNSGEQRSGSCESVCTCKGGKWNCSEKMCSGKCTLEDGMFIETFDKMQCSGYGNDKYIFYTDDKGYSVTAEILESKSSDKRIYLNSVSISVGQNSTGESYKITKDCQISNNQKIDKDFYFSDSLQLLKYHSDYVQAVTKDNVTILCQCGGPMQVSIILPPNMSGTTRGLCGSLDNNAENDFISPHNILEPTPESFFHSWKTSSSPDPPAPSCVNVDNEQFAEKYCPLLRQGAFTACHSTVNYEKYQERCKFVTCVSDDSTASLCTSLENYARKCSDSGVPVLDWRTDICKKSCRNNQVFQYSLDLCKLTCKSRSEQSKCKTSEVRVEDCGCPEGSYLNNEEVCVLPKECECYINNSTALNPGSSMLVNGKKCECTDGALVCKDPEHSNEETNCTGGAEYVSCSDPQSFKGEKTCSNYNLPTSMDEICLPGCYCLSPLVRNSQGKCVQTTECPCMVAGKEYNSGQTTMSKCNQCVCRNGSWDCTDKQCESTCSYFGDQHIRTFDGLWYRYTGICQYTVVTDYCNDDGGSFQIVAQSVPCCDGGLACARSMIVMLPEKNIVLQDGKVTVVPTNSTSYGQNEISLTKDLYMEQVGLSIFFTIENKLSMLWDKSTRVYITLDPKFVGRVCGLCGNNNGDRKDEFTTRQGSIEAGPLISGNSWKTDSTCNDTKTEISSCDKNPYCKMQALIKCNILKDITFQSCHSKVSPDRYYEACLADACKCDMQSKDSGFCNTVATYAHECNRAGACVHWRTPTRCPIFCGYYNTYGDYRWHYEPCGTIKSPTCNDQSAYQKYSEVMEGCYVNCPKKAPYLDTNFMKCVTRSQCSCFYTDVVPAGSSVNIDGTT